MLLQNGRAATFPRKRESMASLPEPPGMAERHGSSRWRGNDAGYFTGIITCWYGVPGHMM